MKEKIVSVKIRKLEGTLDCAEWKRSMKAYLHRDDFMLLRLRKSPKNSDERGTADRDNAQIIAKTNIIRHMHSQPQFRTK